MRAAKGALSVALALVLTLVSAVPAGAAEPVGSANLVVAAGKWRTMAERGVWLGGSGAAASEGRRTRLSVRGGTISDTSARLLNPGALRLTAGSGRSRTTVKLNAMRIELGPRSWLSAKIGDKRRAIFKLERGALSTDGASGAAKLEGARVSWQPATLRTLRKRLGARVPGGTLGSLTITAATLLAETPQSGPITPASSLLPRPATAIDVTAATLAWHVRDSWVRYLNTAQAPQALEGAVPEAAIPESQHPCPDRPAETNPTLVYSYDFPFVNGWYDPPSGSAALYYGGGVRFSYPGHGIEIVARNPEIEINGAAPRAIFNLYGGGQTAYPEQRASLLALTPSVPTQSGPGVFGFPGPLRGTLTADGQRVFAGFYPSPNDGFGCVSVSFRTA